MLLSIGIRGIRMVLSVRAREGRDDRLHLTPKNTITRKKHNTVGYRVRTLIKRYKKQIALSGGRRQ